MTTDHLERDLAEIHLLISRGKYAEASAKIAAVSKAGATVRDTQPLIDEILRRQEAASQSVERMRDIRYYLGMRTTAARIGWFLGAGAGTVYGVWSATTAIGLGLAQGFGTEITTIIHGKTGSSPYTRPIYVDLIVALVILIVSAIFGCISVWASRGAAQWEETDVSMPSRYGD